MSKYLDSRYSHIEPYVPGEQPKREQFIKLNTNENPYPPSPEVLRAVQSEAGRVNRYSDPDARELMLALAENFGVKLENCFAGNGSDEILAFCFQALCPAGVAFPDLTYGFYPVYSRLYDVNTQVVPLMPDFRVRIEDYFSIGRTIVIANPNAPTGLALSRDEIERLLVENADNLVVIDEAYVDFGGQTAIPLTEKYDNLLVVGTFSKSRAMAGARLGYAVGSAELIGDLNRIKNSFNPYNLNSMTMAAGVAALKDRAYFEDHCAKICNTRDKFVDGIRKLGFSCADSLTNFVFVTHPDMDGKAIFDQLRERRILVRWWDNPRIRDYLRISIGTDEEMSAVCKALAEIVQTAG